MLIVADENILSLNSYFGSFGELVSMPGGEIKQQHLLQADALIVRSITKVNAALLEGTRVKFVGTATSGTDHVDLDYLSSQNISFVDAKGSNANAVVDYCFSALAHLVVEQGMKLNGLVFGLIGAGHVGGLFYQKLTQLGCSCQVFDPFLELGGNPSGFNFVSLDEVLQADVVSLHVPYTEQGVYPTQNLLNAENLQGLKRDAVLINTSRGGVINADDLLKFLNNRPDVRALVDVWPNEPMPEKKLVELVEIATPHIAGYSAEAKQQATKILAAEFCSYFQCESPKNCTENYQLLSLELDVNSYQSIPRGWSLLPQAFPLQGLSEEFKRSVSGAQAAQAFAEMRSRLLKRREFSAYRVVGEGFSEEDKGLLKIMGLTLA
jgi:erythronate-4-phosphate dehydrogenase